MLIETYNFIYCVNTFLLFETAPEVPPPAPDADLFLPPADAALPVMPYMAPAPSIRYEYYFTCLLNWCVLYSEAFFGEATSVWSASVLKYQFKHTRKISLIVRGVGGTIRKTLKGTTGNRGLICSVLTFDDFTVTSPWCYLTMSTGNDFVGGHLAYGYQYFRVLRGLVIEL